MAGEGLRFERFEKSKHRRELFDCGVEALNEYLKKRLNQQMRRGVTVGYVLAAPDGRIAGYFTLSAGEIPVGVVPEGKGFPVMLPLPTTLIGRLAVDKEFAGKGLGADLLVHALKVAVKTAESVASAVVEVDVIDEGARGFYAKFGFVSLVDDRNHMYLGMGEAREVVERVVGEER